MTIRSQEVAENKGSELGSSALTKPIPSSLLYEHGDGAFVGIGIGTSARAAGKGHFDVSRIGISLSPPPFDFRSGP